MNFRLSLKRVLIFAAAAVIVVSCAKDATIDVDAVERRVLSAHITSVYKDSIKPLSSGAYLITNKKGSGKKISDTSAVFVKYSVLDLNGEYLQTNIEEIAKNVGGFSYASYFGPTLFEMGTYSMMVGLEEAFMQLNEGSVARIIIPTWASNLDYEGAEKRLSSPEVYDVEIVKVVDDYTQYELDTLERFRDLHYAGLDSLQTGFYFKSLQDGVGDSVEVGDFIYYNYVGRLLDGFVFDTNIEDTARKYNIYDADKDYSPVSYTVTEVGVENNSDEASVVDGFGLALLNMKFGGKAVTFFNSELGYGTTSQSFGTRQQMHFYIEVLEEDD